MVVIGVSQLVVDLVIGGPLHEFVERPRQSRADGRTVDARKREKRTCDEGVGQGRSRPGNEEVHDYESRRQLGKINFSRLVHMYFSTLAASAVEAL